MNLPTVIGEALFGLFWLILMVGVIVWIVRELQDRDWEAAGLAFVVLLPLLAAVFFVIGGG